MFPAANVVQTYFLSITILSQQSDLNLRKLIHDINDKFEKFAGSLQVVHKFKVSGEALILAVVDVPDMVALDNFVETLWDLGSIDIHSDPILYLETFARSIGVAEELINLPGRKLDKDNLYWLNADIDYYGKTTQTFLEIWKREVELALEYKSESGLAVYKGVGQRKVHAFINQRYPGQLEQLIFDLPLTMENGENIQTRIKGIEFLEEFTKQHPLTTCTYE